MEAEDNLNGGVDGDLINAHQARLRTLSGEHRVATSPLGWQDKHRRSDHIKKERTESPVVQMCLP